MTDTTYDRRLSIAIWLFWALTALLAMWECCLYGMYFHVIIFAAYIASYLIGAFAAWRYQVPLEVRALHVCMFFGAINIVAIGYLFVRLPFDLNIRTFLMQVIQLAWLYYRHVHLRSLRINAAKLQDSGVLE